MYKRQIFNFASKSGVVSIEIADGIYKDCLTNKEVVVQDGKIQLDVRADVYKRQVYGS